MTAMWIVEAADGALSQHHAQPGTEGIEVGARWAELPREVDFAVERWDWDAAAIVPDPAGIAARINLAHLTEHGAEAINLAHAVKALEARLILAGQAIEGAVAAEAAATGVSVNDLAAVIVANADADLAAEVARIVARRAVKPT